MKKIINKLYNTSFFYRIFHTVAYCLKRELKDCKTVLDLGCGPSSPLQYSKNNIEYSIGVEMFAPYLEESKKRKIHTDYIEKRIEDVDFPEKSFDAVILIEVLEHLSEEKGYEILEKTSKWARKKVIISTPNGFLPQRARDNNPLQKHLSGWDIKTMNSLGFTCCGLAGFKFLRREAPLVVEEGDFMASIMHKPRFFWFIIATLSQLFTYRFPKSAFELFCVKKIYPIK